MSYPPFTVVQTLSHVWSGYQDKPWFSLPSGHCIEGARIAVEFLAAFEIEAYPVAVDLALQSDEVMVMTSDELREELRAQGREFIDVEGEDTWMGHVMVHVPVLNAYLDMSFGQFRYERAFDIPNTMVFEGELKDGYWTEWSLPSGALANVRANPGNTRWREFYDCLDVEQPVDMLVGDILPILEAQAVIVDLLSSMSGMVN